MCHSGPLSRFTNLSFSSRKITVSHQSFTVLTDFNNFYPQFLLTIFTHNIFTDFHRSSQIFTGLSCHSASIFSFSTWHPVSKIFTDLPQIFPRSFKKTSFLHPLSLGTWTVGHSGPLSSFPQIFTDLHRFILPFSLYLSIFYSASCLQDLHRSSTDLSKIFQKFSFLHPLSLGTWTVCHSGPLSRSPSFPSLLLSLRFITGL